MQLPTRFSTESIDRMKPAATAGGTDQAPWHEGERTMQAATGMRERMEDRGRIVLRDHMPEQHRGFFCAREQLFVTTLDAEGMPWATVIEGEAGFITAPSSTKLLVSAALPEGDPAAAGLKQGAPIGAIGIEFASRRRNRVNGTIGHADGRGFTLDVVQCFGNCPQYIQARRPLETKAGRTGRPKLSTMHRRTSLSQNDIDLISGADTLFIASRSANPASLPSEGLDISHRGGRPGFVRVESERHLTFPDYRGNYFFNTLGNILTDPRCSLLFIDFVSGTTLQVAGNASVVTDPAVVAAWPRAERAVHFTANDVVRTESRSNLSWDFLSFAPQLDVSST